MSHDSTEIPTTDIVIPQTTAFLAYWQALKGDRLAPSWREFDQMAPEMKTIPNVLVVDVTQDPLGFVYRFWGMGHVCAKGFDKTGKSVAEPPRFRGSAAFEEYAKVVTEKLRLAARGMIDLPALDRAPFVHTILRLPLSDDSETVDKVISLAIWESTST